MKYLPLFLCFIFYACVNNNVDTNLYNSSSTEPSSSSVSSSSSYDGRAGGCGVKLSKDTLYFNGQGGVDTIDIGWARFDSIYCRDPANTCTYIMSDYYVHVIGTGIVKIETDYCKNNYCIDMPTDESHILYDEDHPCNPSITKVECPGYSMAFIYGNTLQVSVNKNETGKERSFRESLDAINCSYIGFTVIQSAE